MNKDTYRIVKEKRYVYAVYNKNGEVVSEHNEEFEAINAVDYLERQDAFRRQLLALSGLSTSEGG